MLVCLPQISFGGQSQTDAFLKQQDADSAAFFQGQAAERASFIKKATRISLTKLNMISRHGPRKKMHYGNKPSYPAIRIRSSHHPLPKIAPMQLSTQKQQSDKQVFLAKQAQDRQKLFEFCSCLITNELAP